MIENDFPDVRNTIKLLWGYPYRFYFGKQVKNHKLSHRNRMQKGLKTITDKIHMHMNDNLVRINNQGEQWTTSRKHLYWIKNTFLLMCIQTILALYLKQALKEGKKKRKTVLMKIASYSLCKIEIPRNYHILKEKGTRINIK